MCQGQSANSSAWHANAYSGPSLSSPAAHSPSASPLHPTQTPQPLLQTTEVMYPEEARLFHPLHLCPYCSLYTECPFTSLLENSFSLF